MKRFAVIIANLLILAVAWAQIPVDQNTTIINGYQEKVSGVDFFYHSSIQVAKESMLIRATHGRSSIEWKTAPVPKDMKTSSVTFFWLALVHQ